MGQVARAETDMGQMDQVIALPGPYELARLACKLSHGGLQPPVEMSLVSELVEYGRDTNAPEVPETIIELERGITLRGVLAVLDSDENLSGVAQSHGLNSPQFKFLSILKDQGKEVDDGEGGKKIQGMSKEDIISAVTPVSKKVTFDQRTGTAGHE